MDKDLVEPSQLLEWGIASLALAGEAESGDLHLVKAFPDGVLVTLVDGLGHGSEAAEAARAAVALVEDHAQEPIIWLVRQCHEQLKNTRGVAMTLVSFNGLDGTMTWLGVGNVEGTLLRAGEAGLSRESVLLRGGVVGYQLPPLKASVLSVRPGDTLVLATDGVRNGFAERQVLSESPRQSAERILAEYGKASDDATVLVVRYRSCG